MNEINIQSEFDYNLTPLKSFFYLNNSSASLESPNDFASNTENSKKIKQNDKYKSTPFDVNNNLGNFESIGNKRDNYDKIRKLARRNTVYNFGDISNVNLNNEQLSENSNNQYESILDNKLNKSNFSLSELDNIKRKTIRNLKCYRKKFSSINIQVRKSIVNKLSDFNRRPYFERLIRKNGDANIDRINIEKRHRRYILDLFNTMVDMRCRYILLIFIMSFLISWTFFAILWFFLDVECVNISNRSFLDFILFSIETQQTIGYGARYITNKCKIGLVILMAQCVWSVILQSLLGGIIFAKLSRPKKRTETLIFSRCAVITKRDGVYTFMCRVGDLRKSHIMQAYISMYLIRSRLTKEGEVIPANVQELKVNNSMYSCDRLIFMPTIVEHVIDTTSPLYKIIGFKQNESKSSRNTNSIDLYFKNNDFEIVVILEGTLESTGQTTQARTSFLPNEILFNHIFEPLISVTAFGSKAVIDFSKFDCTKSLKKSKIRIQNETSLKELTSPITPLFYPLINDRSSILHMTRPIATLKNLIKCDRINETSKKSFHFPLIKRFKHKTVLKTCKNNVVLISAKKI